MKTEAKVRDQLVVVGTRSRSLSYSRVSSSTLLSDQSIFHIDKNSNDSWLAQVATRPDWEELERMQHPDGLFVPPTFPRSLQAAYSRMPTTASRWLHPRVRVRRARRQLIVAWRRHTLDASWQGPQRQGPILPHLPPAFAQHAAQTCQKFGGQDAPLLVTQKLVGAASALLVDSLLPPLAAAATAH
jgi:hypothetical protein